MESGKERAMTRTMKFVELIKSLLVAYAITGILLAILAFAILKLQMGEGAVNAVMILIYVFSAFTGGFLTGKRVRERKFLWGLLLGVAYVLVIMIASSLVNKGWSIDTLGNVSTLFLCLGGGMLGGMIS